MAERNVSRERYRLKQHGIPVAWAEGPGASLEIMHYAMVYGRDGPVLIEHHAGGKWRKWPPSPSARNISARESAQ